MEEMIGRLRHILTVVFLSGFTVFLMYPVMPDVIVTAVCSGFKTSCSLAVYLTGLQNVVTGLGAMVMMPVIGNLSDKYGIKTMLTLPMFLSIIPPAILGYRRDTKFFYIYYITRLLFGIIYEGAVDCLAYTYVAKNIHYERKIAAFSILAGVKSISGICGTFVARFLSISSTLQVAAISCLIGLIYMRVFLREKLHDSCNDIIDSSILTHPILQDEPSTTTNNVFNNNYSSLKDMVYLMRTSAIFVQALLVTFFHNLSQTGMESAFAYFLKARFGFNKNNFADIGLLVSIIGSISQVISIAELTEFALQSLPYLLLRLHLLLPYLLFILPSLNSFMGDRKVLSIGLFIEFINLAIVSVAWSAWVPYATTMLIPGVMFVIPSICGIASKQAGPNEQGKVQGCIYGVRSFAGVVGPFIYSPLTALFLSDKAPFDFPGFSLFCVALASLIGFFVSLMIKDVHSLSFNKGIKNSSEDEA